MPAAPHGLPSHAAATAPASPRRLTAAIRLSSSYSATCPRDPIHQLQQAPLLLVQGAPQRAEACAMGIVMRQSGTLRTGFCLQFSVTPPPPPPIPAACR